MILQSLVKYYEALRRCDKIPLPGYSNANVSFAICLSWEGELKGILSLMVQKQRGNKLVDVPVVMKVPEPVVKTSGVSSNFLYENGTYFLGADLKGNASRSKECFETAKALHHHILDDVDHRAAKSILAFFDSWNPELCKDHPIVSQYLEAISTGGNIIFQLPDGTNAQDIEELKQAWSRYSSDQTSQTLMQCLVTGKENMPIARLHNKIKGVRGGQPTGTSIVSFNSDAYESYGKDGEQGINAPVSEYAAFAYTTALNHLIASKNCQKSDNTTIVYWAETGEEEYQDIFSSMMIPEESDEDLLRGVIQKVTKGEPIEESLNFNTRFYVLGLSPNAGRLSIRFFWPSTFGNLVRNIVRHYERLEIEKPSFETRQYLSPYWLLRETVSPASKNQSASPLLEGAMMRSIITGQPYPAMLAQSVLIRIRAEHDINWKKVGILKAWLLNHGQIDNVDQEVLQVSLNKETNNKPYVLGRLFAVLEKAQEEANPGINATIKDRYFSSACSAPATVFPVLLKLSDHHTSKAEYGRNLINQISELMDKLNVEDNPFPSHLPLEDQITMILGYYHERQARFRKKEEK